LENILRNGPKNSETLFVRPEAINANAADMSMIPEMDTLSRFITWIIIRAIARNGI